MRNYSSENRASKPSDLRDTYRNRKVSSVRKSNNGYKFEKRINMLNNLRYFKNLKYLFDDPDNPKETKEKGDRLAGGGIVCGKIRGIEVRIELTKSRPGYLSVKNSEEDLYTARNKVLDDLIKERVNLQ